MPRTQLRNDRKFLGRTSKPEDIVVVSSEGAHVKDARGRSYIDLTSGWCVGNLGWNPKPVVDAVRKFAGPNYILPSLNYPRWTELARMLVDIAPGKLARAYRCTTGTEAVECALQLAMTATGRHKLISLEGAYHGNSFGARSIGAGDVDNLLRGCAKLTPPLDERALGRLETLLRGRDVAALIMEPISMNLSVLIPDGAFMRELVPLCHRYGTLVIADEVACGFGRTGALFACEHFGLEPDLMTIAKAVTNGIAPLASTLATAEVADACEEELSFYATFGWLPLAVEAAIACVKHWRAHEDQILANVADRSNQLRARLSVRLPEDAELHVIGLACAIELGDEDFVSRVGKRCRKHGLLVSDEEDTIELFPPLIIDEPTLAEALDILDEAISAG
ncbi:MAG: aspartate aminotransferase family protein [Deltaproteobacteria bacterium]|nr:aspartate aminotransferase family protein [Deltaproteobacteria bacterium]